MKPMAKLSSKYYTSPLTTCTYFPMESIGHTFRSMSSSGSKIIKNAKKFYEKKNRHRNAKTDQNQRGV